MPVSPRLATVFLLGPDGRRGSRGRRRPPQRDCLSKAEQRAAVASHRAIPLAQAIKSARKHGYHGELIRARLCRRGESLAYVLDSAPAQWQSDPREC